MRPCAPRCPSVFLILSFTLTLPSGQPRAWAEGKRVVKIRTGPSIAQMTKDLSVLRDKYVQASGPDRQDLAQRLRDLARDRAEALSKAIPVNPELLLQVALPQPVYDTLPPDVQSNLEGRLRTEGTIESLRSPVDDAAKTFPYHLRDRQGRTWRLFPVGETPAVVPEAMVTITGIRLREALVFRGTDMSVIPRSGLDRQAPTAAIASPRQGEVVGGTVTIHATAADNQAVAQVSIVKDGMVLESRRDLPYEFSWDTTTEADGPHTLTARANDADLNVGASRPITVTVDNTPPRISLKSPHPKAAVSGMVVLEADAKDAVGLDTVKFLVDGLAVGVVVTPPYLFKWDSSATSNGLHAVEALAIDRAGNTATSEGVEINALNANHAPILAPIGDKTVKEGVALTFRVSAHDPDGVRDPLTFRATNLPSWASFDPVTHEFIGTPDFSEASSDHPTKVYEGVRVEVCDTQPLCASETIALSVLNVDRPPVMNPLGDQTVREGQAVTIAPVLTDPDGDPLTCAAEGVPSWAQFNASACTLSGKPGFDVATRESPLKQSPGVTVQACDPDHQCVSDTFTIEVRNVNRRPVLSRIGDKTVEEGAVLTFAVRAEDPDRDPLGWNVSTLPKGATFTDEGKGRATFSWTPGEDQAGAYPITVGVTDDELKDEETFTITVRETSLSISGVIKDDLGKPMAGVILQLSQPGERTYEARTNDRGVYLAGHLKPGTYFVRPTMPPGAVPITHVIHFSPLSQRIDLTTTDQRGVNFTGHTT